METGAAASQLSIIYRAYPRVSRRTIPAFDAKIALMEFCLSSLCRSLENVPFEFVFVSDGCTGEQKALVERMMKPRAEHFKVVELGGQGNQASFSAQLREAAGARSEKILMLEDDYFVDERDVELNLRAIEGAAADYTTFYYPRDAKASVGGMRKGSFPVAGIEGLEATEMPSTTLTFFARKKTLEEDLPYFQEFVNGTHDAALWLRLTGNFRWFLTRLGKPMFYRNPKLFGSIVRRYLAYMMKHPAKARKLAFVGMGRSSHLDSEGVFNRFSLACHLEEERRRLEGKRLDARRAEVR